MSETLADALFIAAVCVALLAASWCIAPPAVPDCNKPQVRDQNRTYCRDPD